MKVAVVGAGKMGLPLAVQFAANGATVTACDISPRIVELINAGKCPIDEPGVEAKLAEVVRAGRLSATTQTAAAVATSNVVVVIVPAMLTRDKDIDTSILEAASRDIAKTLKPGTLVSYETTMPVGGVRRLLLPVLETSGLRAGRDFDLVFSPERVKSLHVLEHLTKNVKVVGGITAAASRRGTDFYRQYLGAPAQDVGSLEAAEMVKLAGMLYRDVNIALANELSWYAEEMGVDLPALLPAINSDGEAAVLLPGIGVGGHCTPVYPYFFIRDAERRNVPTTLPFRSRQINDGQAARALDALEQGWQPVSGRRAGILGLGFRPGVKETAYSTAFLLGAELQRRGAVPLLHDPLYSVEETAAHGFAPFDLDAPSLPEVLVLVTAHREYAALDFADLFRRGVRAVIDGRNLWRPEMVTEAGLHYQGIGRGRGPKVHKHRHPVARPVLRAEEAEAAAKVVRDGWVLQGPQVSAFEAEFAALVGAAHACAVSSGTAALHLALMAAGVEAGDEVITVSHSYIATANVVRQCGAEPIFVDIDPATYNLDVRQLEKVLSPKTKAVLCVHQMGMPCDLAAVLEFCKAHDLRLVEDAACAAGSQISWNQRLEPIGKPHGDIACFSFHPRKIITTGDGGMITTADGAVAQRLRRLRSHAAAPGASRLPGFERFPEVGYNYRLTDVQAAIGREQLKRLPELVSRRRRIADWYREELADFQRVVLPVEPVWARGNWQSFCVRLPAGAQTRAMQSLLDNGIDVRPGIMNAHEEAAYFGRQLRVPLPESERARRECIILPLYDDLTREGVAAISSAVRAVSD